MVTEKVHEMYRLSPIYSALVAAILSEAKDLACSGNKAGAQGSRLLLERQSGTGTHATIKRKGMAAAIPVSHEP